MRSNDGGAVIVVVGDKQVGKSSLVLSLIADKFNNKVPGVVQPFVLPPEATRDKAPLSVVDTSCCLNKLRETEEFLRLADAIVLVVAPHIQGSTSRVVSYWLPLFQKLSLRSPIILAINLPHQTQEYKTTDSKELFQTLVTSLQIEACMECSAVTLVGVQSVFFTAHRAALSPTRPLWDNQQPSVAFTKALRRIFNGFSADKKGLTDSELNAFHEACFGVKLTGEVTADMKLLVKNSDPKLENVVKSDNNKGLNKTGPTAGPLDLEEFQALLVRMLATRPDSVWRVLTTFHYDRDLCLDRRFFPAPKVAPRGCELSPEAIEFLTAVFNSHASSSSSLPSSSFSPSSSTPVPSFVLTPENFAKVFENCPDVDLFGEALFETISNHVTGTGPGWLSLGGWLSYFAMFGFCCPTQLCLLLGYMGFLGLRDRESRCVSLLRAREIVQNSLLLRAPPPQIISVTVYGHNPAFSLKMLRDYVGFEDNVSTTSSSSSSALFPTAAFRPALSEVYAHQISPAPSFLMLSFAGGVPMDVACLVHDGSARSTSFIRKLLPTLRCSVVVLSDCKKAALTIWPGTDYKVFVHPFADIIASVLFDAGVHHRFQIISVAAVTRQRVLYGLATCTGMSLLAGALYRVGAVDKIKAVYSS